MYEGIEDELDVLTVPMSVDEGTELLELIDDDTVELGELVDTEPDTEREELLLLLLTPVLKETEGDVLEASIDEVEALPLLGALLPDPVLELDSEEDGTEAVTGELGVLVELLEVLGAEEGMELLLTTPVLKGIDGEVTEAGVDDVVALPLLGALLPEPVLEPDGDEDGTEVVTGELDVLAEATEELGADDTPELLLATVLDDREG